MTYKKEDYQKTKEKHLERQTRYRNNPKKREEYLRKAREKSRKWYAENKHRRQEMNKQWWQNKIKELEKAIGRKRPSICEVCEKKGRIVYDHCHKTDKPRGWLCHNCNVSLGLLNDDVETLKKLTIYLEQNK